MLAARMKAVVDRSDYTVSVDYATDDLFGHLAGRDPRERALCRSLPRQHRSGLSAPVPRNVVFRPNGTADAAGFEAVYLKSRSARVRCGTGSRSWGQPARSASRNGRGGIGSAHTEFPRVVSREPAEQGFTLIETMIAMSIAIVVLLANIYLFNTAQRDFALAKSVTEATNLATNRIADFRAMSISRPTDSMDINRRKS